MNRQEQERELLSAMAEGVREYLRTTRGCAVFGANAIAMVVGEDLVVTSAVGEYIFFSSTDLM